MDTRQAGPSKRTGMEGAAARAALSRTMAARTRHVMRVSGPQRHQRDSTGMNGTGRTGPESGSLSAQGRLQSESARVTTMKISVVIPAYNVADYLGQAIESVL